MEITTLALMAAGVAAAWQYIRQIVALLQSKVIVQVQLHGEISHIVYVYLRQHGHVLNLGACRYLSGSEWVRPLGAITTVVWTAPATSPTFVMLRGSDRWYNRLLAFQSPAYGGGSHSNMPENDNLLVLTYLRGTVDITALTKLALDARRTQQHCGDRYRVVRVSRELAQLQHGGGMGMTVGQYANNQAPLKVASMRDAHREYVHWHPEAIGAATLANPFDAYTLDETTQAAREDFTRWLQLKAWYADRHIPWRRGHLYFGSPGTGKTSLARALAQSADIPIYVYDLSTLSNNAFCSEWTNMQENVPCMALIEDIDGTFHGREPVLGDRGGGLTFDCLLNAISGIQSCDGVFVVITTNKPALLDDALCCPEADGGSSRPGRIDRAYELSNPSREQAARLVTRILGDCSDDVLDAVHGKSAAQITEFAVSRAMQVLF